MFAAKNLIRMLSECFVGRCWQAMSLASFGLAISGSFALGAEEIILTYGYFERSISVNELAAFAESGELSPKLANYVSTFRLSDADLLAAQQALNEKVDLSQIVLSQFLNTIQGENLLATLGEVVQTPARQSGAVPIRAAAVLAAADEERGLTLLNFMEKYPTTGIRVNIRRGLDIVSRATETFSQAEEAIALVQAISEAAAQGPEDDLLAVRILADGRPPYLVEEQLLNLVDRSTEATLFLPQATAQTALPKRIPVIVISHGLGDRRTSFAYLGQYLAARGFAVASLDHPGSDGQQITDLLSGLSPNLVDNQEFLNRPADVSALIDEIQRFAQQHSTFRQRLDTNNVGMIGQSFGGYTALALGGATFDPEALRAACGSQEIYPQEIYLNPSLLLQCQAQAIAFDRLSLQDERVQAVLAVNPIGSAIFGESGYGQLAVPVMFVAATADTIAPALPEQIAPFSWLQTEDRYLALAGRTTHFSMIASESGSSPEASLAPLLSTLRGTRPDVAQQYLQTLSLAFFQSHLQQNSQYDEILTARYMQRHLEQPPLQPLSFIRDLSPSQLAETLAGSPSFDPLTFPLTSHLPFLTHGDL